MTANSTPEKDEQVVIDHFNNILEEPEKRFMKNKQHLALVTQRTSDYQLSLMPKRIMSAKRQPSVKKEPVKKPRKDRSALVGVKRTRKSRDQICEL